jgi:hypothetical protein
MRQACCMTRQSLNFGIPLWTHVFLCMQVIQAFLYSLKPDSLSAPSPMLVLFSIGRVFLFPCMHSPGAGVLFSLPTGGGRICEYPSPCPWRTLPHPSALIRGIPFGLCRSGQEKHFFAFGCSSLLSKANAKRLKIVP